MRHGMPETSGFVCPARPREMSDVRFRVDLDESTQVDVNQLRSALPFTAAEWLPAQKSIRHKRAAT